MNDEKKMADKKNKAFYPASNKQDVPEVPQVQEAPKVKIRMRPGRAAEGVTVDKEGYATVDAKLAEHLVKIQYADLAEET